MTEVRAIIETTHGLAARALAVGLTVIAASWLLGGLASDWGFDPAVVRAAYVTMAAGVWRALHGLWLLGHSVQLHLDLS